MSKDIDEFLSELIQVCKKHDMSLGHEDKHGAFMVCRGFDAERADWLLDAGEEELVTPEKPLSSETQAAVEFVARQIGEDASESASSALDKSSENM